jgi:hypothetical protein
MNEAMFGKWWDIINKSMLITGYRSAFMHPCYFGSIRTGITSFIEVGEGWGEGII